MPNTPVRAAAEGMPSINRRRMLLGLAAASTAAATVTIDAVAAPTENPKLLALAAELPVVATAFHEVNDLYRAAHDEWDRKTPWAPDEFTVRGTAWPHDDPKQPGDSEVKALGGYLRRQGEDFPRRIVVKSWHISGKIWDARRMKRRAKKDGVLSDFMAAEAEIKRLKKEHATARIYEQNFRHVQAKAKAWHDEAYPIKASRKEALERHVAAIMNEPDVTMEGLVIKAQALAEWDRVGTDFFDRIAMNHGKDWHGQIAASILRHAQGNVS